jgi:hypothetical protein
VFAGLFLDEGWIFLNIIPVQPVNWMRRPRQRSALIFISSRLPIEWQHLGQKASKASNDVT